VFSAAGGAGFTAVTGVRSNPGLFYHGGAAGPGGVWRSPDSRPRAWDRLSPDGQNNRRRDGSDGDRGPFAQANSRRPSYGRPPSAHPRGNVTPTPTVLYKFPFDAGPRPDARRASRKPAGRPHSRHPGRIPRHRLRAGALPATSFSGAQPGARRPYRTKGRARPGSRFLNRSAGSARRRVK